MQEKKDSNTRNKKTKNLVVLNSNINNKLIVKSVSKGKHFKWYFNIHIKIVNFIKNSRQFKSFLVMLNVKSIPDIAIGSIIHMYMWLFMAFIVACVFSAIWFPIKYRQHTINDKNQKVINELKKYGSIQAEKNFNYTTIKLPDGKSFTNKIDLYFINVDTVSENSIVDNYSLTYTGYLSSEKYVKYQNVYYQAIVVSTLMLNVHFGKKDVIPTNYTIVRNWGYKYSLIKESLVHNNANN